MEIPASIEILASMEILASIEIPAQAYRENQNENGSRGQCST